MAVRSPKAKSDSTGKGTTSPSTSPADQEKISPAKPKKASPAKAKKASVAPPKKAAVAAPEKTVIPAPKKASVAKPKKAGVAKPQKAQPVLTPIRVHYNVGLGNRVAVRGDSPFRWDRGIDAHNTASDIWEFQLEDISVGQTFEFKPLINDASYSAGDNYVGTGGQTLDIYPAF